MEKLRVEFSSLENPQKVYPLEWSILKTPPAQKWKRLLIHCLKGRYPLETRFTGFIKGERDYPLLVRKLQNCIDRINQDGRYQIPEKVPETFSQAFANSIHHHFELLIGETKAQTTYYKNSPPEVSKAVRGLNDIIHEMESFTKGRDFLEKHHFYPSSVHTLFPGLPLHDLADEDYDHFTLDIRFADLALKYNQLGKTWWEVFMDKDEDIFDNNIRPLKYMTGAFDLFFTYPSPEHHLQEMRKDLGEFLIKRNKDPSDRLLGLGYLPVAHLQGLGPHRPYTAEIQDQVGLHPSIKKIELVDGGFHVAREFPPYHDPY